MVDFNWRFIKSLEKHPSLVQLERSDKETSRPTNATNAMNNDSNGDGYQKPENAVVKNVPPLTPDAAAGGGDNSLAGERKDVKNQKAQADNFTLVEDLLALDLNPNACKICKNASLETLQTLYDVKGSDTFDDLDV
ncbi:hypothetical protein ILUMI_20593 [Ignelater luminosus]|uniref:Uncharacterized protein n=1 Tax=Ignelater luminosus TaxID=2038154 RepID=A0A8K0CE06_IGNLU|nr:hypothetical protein ILUMI_20593 [Ignelater luminosus]